MIPIFKERIRLRFEAPLPAGSLRDEVVKAALADTDIVSCGIGARFGGVSRNTSFLGHSGRACCL